MPAEIQTVTTQTEAWNVILQQLAWYNAYASCHLRSLDISHCDE
jgi:hypothetical protein